MIRKVFAGVTYVRTVSPYGYLLNQCHHCALRNSLYCALMHYSNCITHDERGGITRYTWLREEPEEPEEQDI